MDEQTSSVQSVSAPISLEANFSQRTMTEQTSGWRQLLDAIESADKFVALDLSDCTMFGTKFAPSIYKYKSQMEGRDSGFHAGLSKIVEIILPNAATNIDYFRITTSEFASGFTSLKTVTGTNVTDIKSHAFSDITSLTSISFPAATSIGGGAFDGCTSLTSVSFPASTEILHGNPFPGCTALTSITVTGIGALSVIESGKALVKNGTELVGYPAASGSITLNSITTIGHGAFLNCTGLTSVSLPMADSIGPAAFMYCTGLNSASFPMADSIDIRVFHRCTSLTTLNIPNCTDLSPVSPENISGAHTFTNTGSTPLTITMGLSAPTVGYGLFAVNSLKTVTVNVPNGATGYDDDWKAAFRGKGSDNRGADNTNITVNVVEAPGT
jgi:hypothetical protein